MCAEVAFLKITWTSNANGTCDSQSGVDAHVELDTFFDTITEEKSSFLKSVARCHEESF